MVRSLMLALAAWLTLVSAGPADAASRDQDAASRDPDVLVLTGLILIDGTGAEPVENATLVIRGERIEQVGVGIPGELPDGAEVVDLQGMFAVPGLFDVHTHLATNPRREGFDARLEGQLRELLGRGICDVRDMAGDGRVLREFARRTADGSLPGPDIHFAALLAGPGYFGDPRIGAASVGVEVGTAPWAHAVTPETDLDLLMGEIAEFGARGVKLYAQLAPEQVEAVSAAAVRHGLGVWSHWVVQPGQTRARDAIAGGVQVVSHAHMLMHDATPDERVDCARMLAAAGGEALLEQMRARGVILDATLIAAQGLGVPPGSGWATPAECAAAVTSAAREAGVLIATGSDHPGNGSRPGVHLEYELLVEDAGFDPHGVLQAATRVSARAVGISEQRGTLEVGKQATLLLLDEDPLWSVAPLAEPVFVIRRGVVWSGSALRDPRVEVTALEPSELVRPR